MALLVREPLPALHVPFPLGGHCTGSRRRRPGAAPRSPSRRGAEGEVVSGHGLALPTRLHLLLQKRTGRLPVLACAQLVVLIRCMGPVDGPEHSACMIRPTWRRQDGFRGRGSGSDVSARNGSVCWTRAIAAAPAIAAPIAEKGGWRWSWSGVPDLEQERTLEREQCTLCACGCGHGCHCDRGCHRDCAFGCSHRRVRSADGMHGLPIDARGTRPVVCAQHRTCWRL